MFHVKYEQNIDSITIWKVNQFTREENTSDSCMEPSNSQFQILCNRKRADSIKIRKFMNKA